MTLSDDSVHRSLTWANKPPVRFSHYDLTTDRQTFTRTNMASEVDRQMSGWQIAPLRAAGRLPLPVPRIHELNRIVRVMDNLVTLFWKIHWMECRHGWRCDSRRVRHQRKQLIADATYCSRGMRVINESRRDDMKCIGRTAVIS